MPGFERFTKRVKSVLKLAESQAIKYGHIQVETEDLLLSFLEEGQGMGISVLNYLDIDIEKIKIEIEKNIKVGIPLLVPGAVPISAATRKILELAYQNAQYMGHSYVGTEHMLLGILAEREGLAYKILTTSGLTIGMVRQAIEKLLWGNPDVFVSENQQNQIFPSAIKTAPKKNRTPSIDVFGRDLTKLAEEGKLDPVVGRNNEIERITQILCRKKKNNPALLGDAGVGKTAIVEGFAQRIVSGQIPDVLRNKRIVMLDLAAIVAGTKYRGEFEQRIKILLDEIRHSKNVIIFIDELHTLVGAGGAEGSIDASNILKPALSRGEIQCIGATTFNEYKKYIEKDAALERRFQPIFVNPPTVEETIEILKGLRPKYEEHHKLKITDAALVAAAKLSDRYITDRLLPDKAIDVIDESASRQKLKSPEMANIDEENILEVISKWTGIPLSHLCKEEKAKLLEMEEHLHKIVIGQDESISAISRAIRRSQAGIKDRERPIGSFLFLGPTGVGKTLLAHALAEFLFGNKHSIIQVDMSEYMEKFAVSRLIGAPPGYIGYEEGGQLTERVRRQPYCVVLFDEIEKAHPDVFNILLQVLEEGRLTDSFGRTVSFHNAVLIMTSNIGTQSLFNRSAIGFRAPTEEINYDEIKEKILAETKKLFKPEFLNRLDDIIVFHPLGNEDLIKIVEIETRKVAKRLSEQGFKLVLKEDAKEFLKEVGTDPCFGARPLRRAIVRYLEDPLSEEVLRDKLLSKVQIIVERYEQSLTFKTLTQKDQQGENSVNISKEASVSST